MPTKAPTWTSRPSASIGRVIARSSRSASCSASAKRVARGTARRSRIRRRPGARPGRPAPPICSSDRGDHPQHLVADIIAVAVVDRLEAVELERQDDQLLPVGRRPAAQLLAAVGEALAVEQAGHAVGRGDQRGARLALLAHLGFVLQVDIAAPAEQDQRDVEGQGDQRDLEAGPDAVARHWSICWKNSLPFQISRTTAAIRMPSTSTSRRALASDLLQSRDADLRDELLPTTQRINADCLIFSPRWTRLAAS